MPPKKQQSDVSKIRREIHGYMDQSKHQLATGCVESLTSIANRFGVLEHDDAYIKKYRFLDLMEKLMHVHMILDKMDRDVRDETAWMLQK